MSSLPYRIPSPPEKSGGRHGRELVFRPSGDDDTRSGARATTRIVVMGAIVTAIAGAAGGAVLALLAALATAAVLVVRTRAASSERPDAVRFRVEDSLVTVTQHGRVLFRGPLRAIANVALDTKSIVKVRVDNALDVAVQGTSPVRPEVDIARIELVAHRASGPIRLTDGYIPHMDAIEGVAKIRSFLRAHDWTPEDERDDPSETA